MKAGICRNISIVFYLSEKKDNIHLCVPAFMLMYLTLINTVTHRSPPSLNPPIGGVKRGCNINSETTYLEQIFIGL